MVSVAFFIQLLFFVEIFSNDQYKDGFVVLKHVSMHAFFYVIINLTFLLIEAIYYFSIGSILEKHGLVFGFYMATYSI